MLWLAVHMWALLLTSFVIGLGAGWWIWGQREMPPSSELSDAPLGTLDLEEDATATAETRDRS